jgi:hypothetical protein
MKGRPISSHGSYCFLVHHGITVSVCAYITGKVFIHSAPQSSERSSRALQGGNADWEKWILFAMVFSQDGIITA